MEESALVITGTDRPARRIDRHAPPSIAPAPRTPPAPRPFPNGLYKLALRTPDGTEYGVAVLQDGRLRGGDSGMTYVGTYSQDDDAFSAEIVVTPHWALPGMVSALGYNGVAIQLEGTSRDTHAKLRGASKDAPGLRLTATLSLLAD